MRIIPAGSAWMFMAVWHLPLQKLPGHTVLSPFLCLQLGSANLMTFGSPEPIPYSHLVPNSAREPQPSSSQARLGTLMGEAWLGQHRPLVTLVPRLPLLPAWDVTDVQGKLPAMMPVCFVPCDQQRGISAHGGSRSVWLQRHFAAGGEADSKQGSLECAKT